MRISIKRRALHSRVLRKTITPERIMEIRIDRKAYRESTSTSETIPNAASIQGIRIQSRERKKERK